MGQMGYMMVQGMKQQGTQQQGTQHQGMQQQQPATAPAPAPKKKRGGDMRYSEEDEYKIFLRWMEQINLPKGTLNTNPRWGMEEVIVILVSTMKHIVKWGEVGVDMIEG